MHTRWLTKSHLWTRRILLPRSLEHADGDQRFWSNETYTLPFSGRGSTGPLIPWEKVFKNKTGAGVLRIRSRTRTMMAPGCSVRVSPLRRTFLHPRPDGVSRATCVAFRVAL
jgi:hypothetical protein